MENRKKQGPSHSQRLGIIWLSVGLILIATVAFFSSKRPAVTSENTPSDSLEQEILHFHENSVYHSRHKKSYKQQKHNILKQQNTPLESSFYSHQAPTPTKKPLSIELNSADTLTLQLLHGIGPAYASRIVKYRQRLGGFVSTDQLLEVYGFTPELLAHIEPFLTLDPSSIEHININSIGLKQLARHPYIEYYQARDIVRLRQAGVQFLSPDNLRTVPSMADSTLQRILPYIDFGGNNTPTDTTTR